MTWHFTMLLSCKLDCSIIGKLFYGYYIVCLCRFKFTNCRCVQQSQVSSWDWSCSGLFDLHDNCPNVYIWMLNLLAELNMWRLQATSAWLACVTRSSDTSVLSGAAAQVFGLCPWIIMNHLWHKILQHEFKNLCLKPVFFQLKGW